VGVRKVSINPSQEVSENKETRIAERFLLLANDYKSLTGHTLEGQVLKSFVEHPASARLSIIDGARRLKAGKACRKSLGDGKYSLDLALWLEAVYDVREEVITSRVWITDGGSKYHSSRDCKGMRDGQEYARWKGKETYNPQFIQIRRAAFVLGLTPCLVCKPSKYEGS
jgi:hypothetical protein